MVQPAQDRQRRDGAVRRLGGFGGIYAALEFERILRARRHVEVTLVTRDNYFLFTPMLHEVAASDLELSAIISPLRKLLRWVNTFTGNMEKIELDKKCVVVSHGFDSHVHAVCGELLILAERNAKMQACDSLAHR